MVEGIRAIDRVTQQDDQSCLGKNAGQPPSRVWVKHVGRSRFAGDKLSFVAPPCVLHLKNRREEGTIPCQSAPKGAIEEVDLFTEGRGDIRMLREPIVQR